MLTYQQHSAAGCSAQCPANLDQLLNVPAIWPYAHVRWVPPNVWPNDNVLVRRVWQGMLTFHVAIVWSFVKCHVLWSSLIRSRFVKNDYTGLHTAVSCFSTNLEQALSSFLFLTGSDWRTSHVIRKNACCRDKQVSIEKSFLVSLCVVYYNHVSVYADFRSAAVCYSFFYMLISIACVFSLQCPVLSCTNDK